jgi:antitoxin Phd
MFKKDSWQLQVAKARFSELFQRALDRGPQLVTRRGKDEVVVLSGEEYRRLKGPRGPQTTVYDVFVPLRRSGIVLERIDDYGREIEL